MWLELITVTFAVTLLFYRWATKNNDFFKARNIPYHKPTFLLGNNKDVVLARKSFFDVLCDLYNRHGDAIVCGIFDGREPVYLIRDPQLVNHLMIKKFDHFVNRRKATNFESSENLLPNSLFFLQNEKWRDMRNTLTPAFTGSKMRQMFKLIVLEIEESISYLKNHIKDNGLEEVGLEMDVKDFTSRLSVDIIASTAFGLQVNSLKNKDNEFYIKAQRSVNFTRLQQIKLMIMQLLPKIAQKLISGVTKCLFLMDQAGLTKTSSTSFIFSKLNFVIYFVMILKLDIFDKEFSNYFMNLVLDAMKYRVENHIQRPDMINLLMEAKGMIPTDTPKAHFREWSDVEVVAQCFLFFFASMEPSSAILSFSVHELMQYPKVQKRLYEEIQRFGKDLENQTLTYDILQKMPYMDKVVSELLRKWPVTLVTVRVCTKDFVYESQGKRLEIKKGELVRIPMCAIHRDVKYYPEPEVLDPERFSDENKSQIKSGAYLPFGLGPRACIANRFAVMEIKAFLFYLIRDYRLEASVKTVGPFMLKKSGFQVIPENGFWVRLKKRI